MNQGLFEHLVMFFGLTNIPAKFQMIINDIFQELIDERTMAIYMDNIPIFGSQTKEQHHTIVVWVLNILHNHHLYLKAEVGMFRQSTVEYLSLILLEGRMEMDPIKVVSV